MKEEKNIEQIIKEKCPNCKNEGGLFRCSLGALNCANCMSYIRE